MYYLVLIKVNNEWQPKGLFTSPSDGVNSVNKDYAQWKIYVMNSNSDTRQLYAESRDDMMDDS